MNNPFPTTNDGSNSNAWLLTFADLLALILTFFILFYSMTSLDDPKWEKVHSSLTSRFNPKQISNEAHPTTTTQFHIKEDEAKDIDYLYTIVNQKIINLGVNHMFSPTISNRSLIIFLDLDILKANSQTSEAFIELGIILSQIANRKDITYFISHEKERSNGLKHAANLANILGRYGSNFPLNIISSPHKPQQTLFKHAIAIVIHPELPFHYVWEKE